jgi:predicted dehydrogenase
MKVLVAGTGSIGRRHIASLRSIEPETHVMLLRRHAREDDYSLQIAATVFAELNAALDARPDFAIIATPTILHADLIGRLLEAEIPMYVEKPVVATREQAAAVEQKLRTARRSTTLGGCNLRFLPSLIAARELVHGGKIGRVVRASFQVGQWLPDWRPGTNAFDSYSASIERGGGVVLDLVHELDAARWMLGEFDFVAALGGHYSSMRFASEDVAVIALSRPGGPAIAVAMDYVSRVATRRYELIGDEGTLIWDLPSRHLELRFPHGSEFPQLQPGAYDVAGTYVTAMREFVAAVRGETQLSQDLAEGLRSAMLAIRANEAIRQ